MFVPVLLRELLSPVHTVAKFGDCRQCGQAITVVLKGQAHAREMNSEFNAVSPCQ